MTASHLKEPDFNEAAEAYVHFCAGLAIVQYPEYMAYVHRQEDIEDNIEAILGSARDIMINGCRRFIRASLPADQRSPLRKPGPHHGFSEAEPAMRELLDFACLSQEGRLVILNEMYPVLRPAPFLQPGTYSSIVRGDFPKIKTADLMDDFVPDPVFLEEVYNNP